jgi:LysR family carnitine catabolism transcriptional activator
MARVPSLGNLRLFMHVAHHRSFSEASRHANLSQPALSRVIRMLEEDLGARLFDRTSRSVTLTSAGEALLPIVERLATDFDHAFSDLALDFAGQRGRVIVGAQPSVAAEILPQAIAGFSKAYPHVEVIIRDTLSGTLYQQMRERQIDFAITTPPAEDDFEYLPLFDDPVVLVVPSGGQLDTTAPGEWSIFSQHPFIAMSPRSSVRELTDAAMEQAGVAARPLYDCAQLTTLGALIEAGLGITALPRSAADMLRSRALSLRPLVRPAISRTIGIARLQGRTLPPAAQAFLKHLRGHLADQE